MAEVNGICGVEFKQQTIGCPVRSRNSDPKQLQTYSFQHQPPTTFEDYSSELNNAIEKFSKDWFELYYCTILRQSKWVTTTGQFTPGDIVLVSDLKGYLGYPVLGRVKSVEQDSDGIP